MAHGMMLDTAAGYQPAQAYGEYMSPDDMATSPEQALRSGLVTLEQIPRPPQGPAPRLDGKTLDNKFLSWEQAKTASGEIHEQFMASRYYHGKQWTDAEIKELKRRKQPVSTKNRIKRKVDFLVGVEQRLRRDPKCYPRTPSAEQAAHISTASLRSVEDETKWPAIASAATKDALVRGIGVVWQGAKIVRGKAEVRKSHVPSDRFFYDPCSEAWDFSDARFLGEWQWLDMDQASEMMPFAAEMIETLGHYDGSLSLVPQEFAKLNNRANWIETSRRLIRVTHIWYRYGGDWLYDYLCGPISLCPGEHNCRSPYVDEDGQTVHPYNAWSPYIDESGVRYGVVRDMMPLQDGINKRTSKMLYMLTVRQTMGMKGAVDDVDKMKVELAKPDGHVELNSSPDTNGFQIIDQSAQTQGQFELLQEDKAEIENLGPNPALIGRGVEDQSGRAILAQQNSGMTELSPVFEMKREWELAAYHKDWNLIRQFWNGERYIRVTSDPKAVEFLHVNRIEEDPMTGQVTVVNAIVDMDVDVILDQGPDTVTMREELIQAIADRPDVPLELILELSTLPDKEVMLKRLQEAKAPPPEMVELQQKMANLEMALQASKVDESVANVENKRATTMKVLGEAGMNGVPPQLMPAIFPISYREPTMLERMQAAAQGINQMMAQQGGEEGPMPGPEGSMPSMSGFAQQPPPNPMLGGEPQINQPGGLPLGPGVGPQ
jgi:hypothetical protein